MRVAAAHEQDVYTTSSGHQEAASPIHSLLVPSDRPLRKSAEVCHISADLLFSYHQRYSYYLQFKEATNEMSPGVKWRSIVVVAELTRWIAFEGFGKKNYT